MRFQPVPILAAATVFALAAYPALATQPSHPVHPSHPDHPGGAGVPGPIAGAGLTYLALAGGYYAFRRWRKHNAGD